MKMAMIIRRDPISAARLCGEKGENRAVQERIRVGLGNIYREKEYRETTRSGLEAVRNAEERR